jgi:predicted alpha/beta-hydrolase family hydrolase
VSYFEGTSETGAPDKIRQVTNVHFVEQHSETKRHIRGTLLAASLHLELLWTQSSEKNRKQTLRTRTKIFLAPLTLIVVAAIGFVVWAETPLGPMPQTEAALRSDSAVRVTRTGGLAFSPAGTDPKTGLILYPGGRVDFRSYAPLARTIAEQGYLVVIVRMPLNLAVLNTNKAAAVIKAYPTIKTWVVGGHSLGGAMAAQFAAGHVSSVAGLVLLAAYPPSGTDLSGTDLDVLTIRGSNDGLTSSVDVDRSLERLPESTIRVEIEGGNHAQFGYYGNQPGDGRATISREEQVRQVTDATVKLLGMTGQ